MGIDDDGLWIGVADDAQALISLEVAQLILELRTKIVALQLVDGARETFLMVEGHEARTARAKM